MGGNSLKAMQHGMFLSSLCCWIGSFCILWGLYSMTGTLRQDDSEATQAAEGMCRVSSSVNEGSDAPRIRRNASQPAIAANMPRRRRIEQEVNSSATRIRQE